MTDLSQFYSPEFKARLRLLSGVMMERQALAPSDIADELGCSAADFDRLIAGLDNGEGYALLPVGSGNAVTIDVPALSHGAEPFNIDFDRFYAGTYPGDPVPAEVAQAERALRAAAWSNSRSRGELSTCGQRRALAKVQRKAALAAERAGHRKKRSDASPPMSLMDHALAHPTEDGLYRTELDDGAAVETHVENGVRTHTISFGSNPFAGIIAAAKAAKAEGGSLHTRDSQEILERRATSATTSYNAETRTLEVVFATAGAAVARHDMRGAYTELLALDGFSGAEGAPFLDHHKRDELDSILGSIVSTSVVGTEARAVIRLSKENPLALRLAAELVDGHRFGVSVGYEVAEWKERTENGQRIKEAVRWTIREISIVSVGADPLAGTRSQDGGRGAGVVDRAVVNAQIRSLARPLGLSQAWIDGQIDAGRSFDEAQRSAMTEMVTRGQAGHVPMQRAEIGTDYTDPDFRARTLGEALYTRINRTHNPTDAARQYLGLSMVDMARDCLRVRGVALSGLSSAKIIERALHTTSDFPLILGNATGRTLRESYRVAGSALKALGRQVNHIDFRERQSLMLSEGPMIEKLNESGEIKAGTMIEAKESYKLETYAKRFGISRQALVNDDTGAFADIGRRMGQGAAATEAQLLVDLLVANSGGGPKMADGRNLFHADHKNLSPANSGGTPWITNSTGFVLLITAGRLLMRRQVTLQGQPIAARPKYLIVPSEGETLAEQTLTAITAAKPGDVNPFAGNLTLIVEPRLKDTKAWYLAADPAEIDGLEWSYLEGEEGPQIETRAGWEIEGVEIKVREDFGAGFVDWRGWYRNAGDA